MKLLKNIILTILLNLTFKAYGCSEIVSYKDSIGDAQLEVKFNKENNTFNFNIINTALANQIQTRYQAQKYKNKIKKELDFVIKLINQNLKNKNLYLNDILQLIQELDKNEILDKGLLILKASKLYNSINCSENTSLDPQDAKMEIFCSTLSSNIFSFIYLLYGLYHFTITDFHDYKHFSLAVSIIISIYVFSIICYKIKTKDHILFKLKLLLSADPNNLANLESKTLKQICDSLNLPMLKELVTQKS